jgi:peroxiredoxin
MLAPVFQEEDLFGTLIDLHHYRGRSVLLSFYRNAACALCNLQVKKLIGQYAHYQKQGLDLIGVFEAPRENMLQYVGQKDAPFPLISDPEGHLYALYGIEVSEEKVKQTMATAFGQQRIQEAANAGFALTPEPGSNFHRIPADFLINPEGKIHTAFYADLLGEHLDSQLIDSYLKNLNFA